MPVKYPLPSRSKEARLWPEGAMAGPGVGVGGGGGRVGAPEPRLGRGFLRAGAPATGPPQGRRAATRKKTRGAEIHSRDAAAAALVAGPDDGRCGGGGVVACGVCLCVGGEGGGWVGGGWVRGPRCCR